MASKNDVYTIYGRRPVQEFLQKNDTSDIEIIYISESAASSLKQEIKESVSGSLLKIIPRKAIDKMFPDVNHQGIVIRMKRSFQTKKNLDQKNWKTLLESADGLVVLLDRIQDPFNAGNIIRTAEALGAKGVILTGKGASPGPTVDRASAGATMHLPHFQVQNADHVIEIAKECGYWIASSVSPHDIDATQLTEKMLHLFTDELSALPDADQILLIIGNEGGGIKNLIMKKTDFFISIPLSGETSSLNAGTAAGILMDRILNRK